MFVEGFAFREMVVPSDRATAETMIDVVSILATLFCASAAEFFTAESWNLRYVDGVVGVAARLDIVLGIRLIDGS
jgi:uncharacterized membrane protein